MSRKTLKKSSKKQTKETPKQKPQEAPETQAQEGASPITEMLSNYLEKKDAQAVEQYTKAVLGNSQDTSSQLHCSEAKSTK